MVQLEGSLMTQLATILKEEIRRLARRELNADLIQLKKYGAQHRRDIAKLKRENDTLKRQVSHLQKQLGKVKGEPAPAGEDAPPPGTRFSTRSLRAQRTRAGLSQADYAKLLGVSTLTMNNWENGKTRPSPGHISEIVALRGLGKREAARRLEAVE